VREWTGAGAAAGVYFVRLDTGDQREVKKLVRVR
jgi:hypothetical protein